MGSIKNGDQNKTPKKGGYDKNDSFSVRSSEFSDKESDDRRI